jgi:hypothetical protein
LNFLKILDIPHCELIMYESDPQVGYYQYLKGESASIGLGREELLLRVAQRSAKRTGDSKVLNVAMAKLHGADQLCTLEPHLVWDEVFGSQSAKPMFLLVLKASHIGQIR